MPGLMAMTMTRTMAAGGLIPSRDRERKGKHWGERRQKREIMA